MAGSPSNDDATAVILAASSSQLGVLLLLAANTINIGADLGAMGEALRLLIGGPAHLYVVAFAVGCVLLEIFSRYARYVEILKWTTLSLLSYVATALVVDVPWREVAYHTFVPSFIWQKDYIVTIVAVLGTTITPYCFFWQSSQEAEDERIDSAAHPLLEPRKRRAPRSAAFGLILIWAWVCQTSSACS